MPSEEFDETIIVVCTLNRVAVDVVPLRTWRRHWLTDVVPNHAPAYVRPRPSGVIVVFPAHAAGPQMPATTRNATCTWRLSVLFRITIYGYG